MVHVKGLKRAGALLLFTTLTAVITIGCQDVTKKSKTDRGTITAPSLTLSSGGSRIRCEWTPSNPYADTYDIYYRKGTYDNVEDVKKDGSIKLENKTSPFTVTNLVNGERYTFVITAIKEGYETVDSVVKTGRPTPSANDTDEPGRPAIPGEENGNTAMGLIVVSASDHLIALWLPSDPPALSYDIYYREGIYDVAEDIKDAGVKLANQDSPFSIPLPPGGVYSVIITANVPDGSIDSAVVTGKPGSVVRNRSPKRGVGYNFNTIDGTNKADMDLMAPTISWFYDWGHAPQEPAGTQGQRIIEKAAREHKVEYMPMAWSDIQPDALRQYVQRNPECRYLLTFNEPNLVSGWESFFQLPSEAAAKWPAVLVAARENNLKVVSPAMALVGEDPIEWMDAFLAQPEVSMDDIVAISIHSYMNGPSAFREVINRFKKYNRPVWMTEWCAWDGGAWDYHLGPRNVEQGGWEEWVDGHFQMAEAAKEWVIPKGTAFQMWFLSQTAMYMEQDPWLERYAWFIPKRSGEDYEHYPWMDLLTWDKPPKLTDMGKVFVNMSTCDKSVWVLAGQLIEAKDFSANNLAEWAIHTNDGWQNSVTFRVSTDPDKLSVLDIWYWKVEYGYMWAEYQVYLDQAKPYALTLRYSAPKTASMTVYVDGKPTEEVVTLEGASWQTKEAIPLGNLSKGQHTIRLRVNGGADTDLALNWLKVD